MPYLRIGPLVRATSPHSVVIWAELSEPCTVELQIIPDDPSLTAISVSTATIQVGRRSYIAPQVEGLRPATWYTYSLSTKPGKQQLLPNNSSIPLQCFRTFAAPAAVSDPENQRAALRVAYGSCRKAEQDVADALPAFGNWLKKQYDQREDTWPHLLLCIGDQIYADEPPAEVIQAHPNLRAGARIFEDFCILYEHAWAHDPAVQQALATVPSFMIFDDHEVLNNWNVEPAWRNKILEQGGEQLLVDALVAYWVYQGWGNLHQRSDHPLLAIMRAGAQSGEDVLERLRSCIKTDLYHPTTIHWHYTIPTQPAIFVANARTERTTVFDPGSAEIYGPTRIMSEEQMQEIRQWLQAQSLPIVVSSVPILLPPVIGLLQYLTGLRLWLTPERPAPLRSIGKQIARLQRFVAARVSFDHWPLYTTTWHEFIRLLQGRRQELIILSGDVHFSYALAAQATTDGRDSAHLYQFVSTPFQNTLDDKSAQKVRMQARVPEVIYGGLRQWVLPLQPTGTKARIYRQLLFENTLALLTLQPLPSAGYEIKHEYMSLIDGELQVVGSTMLPAHSPPLV